MKRKKNGDNTSGAVPQRDLSWRDCLSVRKARDGPPDGISSASSTPPDPTTLHSHVKCFFFPAPTDSRWQVTPQHTLDGPLDL